MDFRSNFGSYMSCFSQSGNGEAPQGEALWNGRLQVNESDRLPQSAFQRELGILEEEEEEQAEEEEKERAELDRRYGDDDSEEE